MTIPTRPAPPPPQNNRQQVQQNEGVNENQPYGKITITLPPPPSSKNRNSPIFKSNSGNESILSKNSEGGRSITRHFPVAKTRYAPTSNWSGNSFDMNTNNKISLNRKTPPPRPPPPKPNFTNNESKISSDQVFTKNLKSSQSINVLSNLFGRRKSPSTVGGSVTNKVPPKIPQLINSHNTRNNYGAMSSVQGASNSLFNEWPTSTHSSQRNTSNISPYNHETNDVQLISFDSPPNSPTFTQKSNSDCVSVDSFSSDSNFSSPHNGSASQPESGFEDDFSTAQASSCSTQLTTPVDPWDLLNDTKTFDVANGGLINLNNLQINNTANISGHPIRNLHILQRKQTEQMTSNVSNVRKTTTSPPIKSTMPTIIRPKGLAPKPPSTTTSIFSKKNNQDNFSYENNLKSEDTFEDDIEEPPMPSFPPPPPPPILGTSEDDYQNENISYEQPYGIALYDFEGYEDGDLSFRENEKIYILNEVNEEWLMGKNRKGCEGIFPANFIDIKVPLKKSNANKDAGRTENKNLFGFSSQKNSIKQEDLTKNLVKVLYTFEASYPEDLTILENQMVKVLYRINDDWLYGEIENRKGQFPANFVERIPDNLDAKMP